MVKVISCLCFCGLSIALYAQSALQTFTSPDGAFQFKYSAVLVRCTPKEGQLDFWVPDGQLDVPNGCICDDHQGSAIIVCFTHPGRSEHFLGAFFVAEVQPGECMEHWPNTTCRPLPIKRKDCLAGSSNWWSPETPQSTTRGQNTRIDSVRAKLFRVSGGGLGHFESSDIYRVFHGKRCYELVIQDTGISLGAFDPEEAEEIEKAAKEDDKDYGQLLSQALHSFRFLAAGCP
jgi:hypothetical protein